MLPTHCPQGHEYTEDNIGRKKDGHFNGCRICNRARARAWRLANPERFIENAKRNYQKKREQIRVKMKQDRIDNPDKYRNYEMSSHFHITLEQYNAMLDAQGGICLICQDPATKNQRLHIDHDHRCCPTQKRSCGRCIRGLLCNACNQSIGGLKDSPEILRRAANYVEEHSKRLAYKLAYQIH